MPLALTLEGDEAIIAASMEAFAKGHGWKETINDAPNPVTQAEHSAGVIKSFLRESIKAYNCNQAAEAARQAAAEATDAAANSLTITLTEV